jgi:hypothetical protein
MSDPTLRRITRDEVPMPRRWQLNAVWDLEVALVKQYLDQRAAENLGKAGATVDSALADGANLAQEIHLTFGAQSSVRDPRILNAAANGVLEREAPTRRKVIGVAVARTFFFFLEITIFVLMVALGFSSFFVIIVGFLLGGAGLLTGDGAGRVLVRRERERDWGDTWGWIELVIGGFGIAAICYIRTVGEEEGVFAIVAVTGFLAVLIATLHAMHIVLAETYRQQHQRMFSAQAWFATDEHMRAYQAEFWNKYYAGQVRALSRDLEQIKSTHGQSPVAQTAPDGSVAATDSGVL